MAEPLFLARKPALLGLPLAAALMLAVCGQGSDTPFADAQAALASHDYPAARVLLQQALEEDPANDAARLLYARTLITLGNAEGAIAQLQQLGGGLSGKPEAVALMARAQVMAGKAQDALDLLEREGMDSGEAYAAATAAWLNLGNPAKANAALDQGLAAYPQSADLLALAAQRDFDLGKSDTARGYLESALAAAPDHVEALRLAGRLELRERNLAAARGHFERLMAIIPWDLPSHLAMAAIARDSGDDDTASEWIAKATEIAPGNPVSAYFAAEMAFEAGEVDDAQVLLSEIDRSGVDFPALWLLRGRVSASQGNPKTAMSEYERYFATGGDSGDARFELAQLYRADGKAQDAWDILAPAIGSANVSIPALLLGQDLAGTLGRGDRDGLAGKLLLARARAEHDAQLRAADAALRAGDWKAADAAYSALLKGAMEADPMVLNNAANVRLKLGDAAGGQRLARQAYRLAPDDPFILDTLGWSIYQSDGRTGEAIALVRRAYQLAPDNAEIAEHWLALGQAE